MSLVSFRYRPPKDPNVYSPSGAGPFSSDAFQPCVKTPLINLVDAGVAAVSKPASCPSATLNLSGFGPTSSYSVSLSASPSFSIVVASAIAVVVVVVVSEDDAFSEFFRRRRRSSLPKRSSSHSRNARRRSPLVRRFFGFSRCWFLFFVAVRPPKRHMRFLLLLRRLPRDDPVVSSGR